MITKIIKESMNANNDIHVIYNYNDFNTMEFGSSILEEIEVHRENDKPILVACIGTDKHLVDTLGPIVGTILERDIRFNKLGIQVIGTLEKPCHALTLNYLLDDDLLSGHFVIGIDACLGDESSIGKTHLRRKPLRPGKGAGKDLKEVGDISIVSILAEELSDPIRLHTVYQYAEKIAESIILALSNMRKIS